MAGYIARQGVSLGTHDPLFVRTLVLQQGRVRIAIVVADLLLISNKWSKRLRLCLARILKTSPDHVFIAATHTHSGPQVDAAPFQLSSSMTSKHQERTLLRRLESVMEQTVRNAVKFLQPVRMAIGRAVIRGIASDRNRPKLAVAQPFHVFRFEGPSASAMLAVYGCHPTMLGADNLYFSGDLHGEIARQFERHAGLALVANGAAANISTRFTRRNQSAAELKRLARRFMKQASTKTFRPTEYPKLSLQTASLKLSVRNLRTTEETNSSKSGRLGVVAKEAWLVQRQLQKSLRIAGKTSVTARITALRLGKVRLVALPFEIYASTGDFLWKKVRAVPLCYANGYWGYVPARSAPADDYEVVSSLFSAQADERLRRIILALAKRT